MEIRKVIDYEIDQNCYFIRKNNKENYIIIDPGSSKVTDIIKKENLKINYILLTHCHYDHVKEAENIKKITGAKVIATAECKENMSDYIINAAFLFGRDWKCDCIDMFINDNEIILSDGLEIKCIKTPGHTSCGVCYLIEDNLFSGDTLFLRTTGRWDLKTASGEELIKSIKEKLFKLDENINVYPGHGEKTTIGYEKNFNMVVNNY